MNNKDFEFNNLNNVANSNVAEKMSDSVIDNLRKAQTDLPKESLPEHVVLPVFKKS